MRFQACEDRLLTATLIIESYPQPQSTISQCQVPIVEFSLALERKAFGQRQRAFGLQNFQKTQPRRKNAGPQGLRNSESVSRFNMNTPHTLRVGSLGVTEPTGSRSAIARGSVSNPGDASGDSLAKPKRKRLGPAARQKLQRRTHLVRCTNLHRCC